MTSPLSLLHHSVFSLALPSLWPRPVTIHTVSRTKSKEEGPDSFSRSWFPAELPAPHLTAPWIEEVTFFRAESTSPLHRDCSCNKSTNIEWELRWPTRHNGIASHSASSCVGSPLRTFVRTIWKISSFSTKFLWYRFSPHFHWWTSSLPLSSRIRHGLASNFDPYKLRVGGRVHSALGPKGGVEHCSMFRGHSSRRRSRQPLPFVRCWCRGSGN